MRKQKEYDYTRLTDLSDRPSGTADCVKQISLSAGSSMYAVKLWEGVYIWANVINDSFLPAPGEFPGDYVTFNYGIDGRCEVTLRDDTFVYVEKDIFCVDCNEPVEGYYYPGSRYQGLEIAVDLDALGRGSVLSEFGFTRAYIEDFLSPSGTYLGVADDKMRAVLYKLFEELTNGMSDIYAYRCKMIEFLFGFMNYKGSSVKSSQYCSKGQREIAMNIERRLTEDLSRRITIDDIAKNYGVSPSACKKYFEAVYGDNISNYIRRKRLEQAKIYLSYSKTNIGDISSAVGYAHQGKFGAAFKEYTGLTPLEYRRRNYHKEKERHDEIK